MIGEGEGALRDAFVHPHSSVLSRVYTYDVTNHAINIKMTREIIERERVGRADRHCLQTVPHHTYITRCVTLTLTMDCQRPVRNMIQHAYKL